MERNTLLRLRAHHLDIWYMGLPALPSIAAIWLIGRMGKSTSRHVGGRPGSAKSTVSQSQTLPALTALATSLANHSFLVSPFLLAMLVVPAPKIEELRGIHGFIFSPYCVHKKINQARLLSLPDLIGHKTELITKMKKEDIRILNTSANADFV
jgi:hypothetical protein